MCDVFQNGFREILKKKIDNQMYLKLKQHIQKLHCKAEDSLLLVIVWMTVA